MQKTILCLLFLFSIASCGESKREFVARRLDTAERFMGFVAADQPERALDLYYRHGDGAGVGKEMLMANLKRASKIIGKYGLPPREKWSVIFHPNNRLFPLIVQIPLFEGRDPVLHLLRARVVLSFPPPNISDKIADFDLQASYEPVPLVTLSAPPVDVKK